MKKLLSLALALALCLGLTLPANAASTGQVGQPSTISASSNAYITRDGRLMMWEGDSYAREPGENTPTPNMFAEVMRDVASFAYSGHFAVLKTDGTLWCWGGNDRGEVGIGLVPDSQTGAGLRVYTPKKVMDNVAAVSCFNNVTAAIKTDGSLWMWGANHYGHLGNGGVTNAVGRYNWECLTVPTKIMDDVATVSVGGNFCAAIKTDGSLWTWGLCEDGYLGDGNEGNVTYLGRRLQNVPNKIMDDVAAVSCASYHTLAVKTDGSLWGWGCNRYGELGNGGVGDERQSVSDGSEVWFHQTVPAKVMDGVAAVNCCENRSFILKPDGSLLVCGKTYGIIEENKTVNQKTPVKIADGVAVPSKPSPTVAGFSDVHESDYFADAVVWAKETGVTGGTSATTFSPNNTVTRADAMTFLWRGAGSPEPESLVSPFSDVTDAGAYYYKAVLWAAENGITSGVSATDFGIKNTLSYDQILAFLFRAAGETDVGSDWSAAAVKWAAENGLTAGLTFTAKGNCPRSDVIYCLWKQLA